MDALISPQRFRPLDVKWGNEYAEVKFDEICWEFGEDFQQIITNFSTNSASNFYIQGKTSGLTSHENAQKLIMISNTNRVVSHFGI